MPYTVKGVFAVLAALVFLFEPFFAPGRTAVAIGGAAICFTVAAVLFVLGAIRGG